MILLGKSFLWFRKIFTFGYLAHIRSTDTDTNIPVSAKNIGKRIYQSNFILLGDWQNLTFKFLKRD